MRAGGPSGLSAAIRLLQLASEQEKELRVIVLEKGGEVGILLHLHSHAPAYAIIPAQARIY